LILHAIGRLILVPLGFILAIVTAIAILLTLGLEITTQTLARQATDADKIDVLIDMGFSLVRVFAAASILPALLVVIVGEVARIRSVLYYVLGGGLALAMFPVLARIGTALPDSSGSVPLRAWAVLSTAGFAGGLVYWIVAGRRA
jgi:hypothetical protein